MSATCGMDYTLKLLCSLGPTRFIPVHKLPTYILPPSGKSTHVRLQSF